MEIMAARKIAYVVSMVLISEAYNARITFFSHGWKPISSFKIGDDKVDIYSCRCVHDGNRYLKIRIHVGWEYIPHVLGSVMNKQCGVKVVNVMV
ncbi:hypothetical protein DY000_02042773 [Brassica cretica]|uniref:Uncharacterized protein n=1 Tax=Brassica cretica TaxID=69181 RepID=A0ABQ7B6V1_BRACR|nr:hypothetical protein DY000_02042773 [Brassica cretica]